ncbi:hypothetical protein GGR56DRAFT_646585 [Xylariaceae sp. FL0804]|nr:hypothetical protein GGR56DRAFT_646585 [Xylariaceae sp. FL0804]
MEKKATEQTATEKRVVDEAAIGKTATGEAVSTRPPTYSPRVRTSYESARPLLELVCFIFLVFWCGRIPFLYYFAVQPHNSLNGKFPEPGDPFHFLPCTNTSLLPALDDPFPGKTWSQGFDPDPTHWLWGNSSAESESRGSDSSKSPFAGRGIYLCGYLDVPLDYTNRSEPRIVRLAVFKYQVSGVALPGITPSEQRGRVPGSKSQRTVVIEPGGPGGSGAGFLWRSGEQISKRYSDGQFDVLAWDPRGVNATLPAISCFPYDADRDRWYLLPGQYRETTGNSSDSQLELADAWNKAVYQACWELHGDLPRFVGTAFVARDLEQIRIALGEDELTGYLVSYGTGIGQTYANMFPDSVGRMILDGTEYVRDHRLLGGFGWTALDNSTDAWHDGFLGECLNAGPEHCALAKPKNGKPVQLPDLEDRMGSLLHSLLHRPIPGYGKRSGPSLVTYSGLVGGLYSAMYNAETWPALAQMLSELEDGNSTLATAFLEKLEWEYNPSVPSPLPPRKPASDELGSLVICADSYDAPQPDDGLAWWSDLWANMTARNWLAGNSRFFSVLPCRHFGAYWPSPAEVYRGDLNHTLRHPVLLIAETYDPATPLRNGRRLLREMTAANARLVVHHGYGHSSRDTSSCTNSIARDFILRGELPDEAETDCFADEKPYLYGVGRDADRMAAAARDPVEVWREHMLELTT